MNPGKYSSQTIVSAVVAFSISYEEKNLLARGLGFDHLRELLIRIARPCLRQGAALAYAGGWNETKGNFTFELLRLVSAEQAERGAGDSAVAAEIKKLYNHSAWPLYLPISPAIEAEWINSCRIVRITQEMAGFERSEVVPDAEASNGKPRSIFNAAVTLSAMRRLTVQGIDLSVPDVPRPETIRPVVARVLLGGKVTGYSGFIPGIFEEALVMLSRSLPTYLLGGFGGAAEVLAKTILDPADQRPPELTVEWHQERNERLSTLLEASRQFALPSRVPGLLTSAKSLDELYEWLRRARSNSATVLNTGLSEPDTRELLATRDVNVAVRLVRQGLMNRGILQERPA